MRPPGNDRFPFQFFRQMDAAMVSDNAVAVYRAAFLRGDYGLEEINRKEPSEKQLTLISPVFIHEEHEDHEDITT